MWLARALRISILGLLACLGSGGPCAAAAPILFRTAGFEAPVQAEPDSLLFIPGDGFQPTDRVVYQVMPSSGARMTHPAILPSESDRQLGIAPVVHFDAAGHSLTAHLPENLDATAVYRIWVVNHSGEWSEPILVNDSRPLWITPSYGYVSADLAGTHRQIRVVGRNLSLRPGAHSTIRLHGPAEYDLVGDPTSGAVQEMQRYVVEATLPPRMLPGSYTVSLRCQGCAWTRLPAQSFVVRPDPISPPTVSVSDSRFGMCHPDDDIDDSNCFQQAIEAARQSGGVVYFPPGKWILTTSGGSLGSLADGFVLPLSVGLRGAGSGVSSIVWRARPEPRGESPLLTLSGGNSITGITFADEERFSSPDNARPVIRLGTIPDDRKLSNTDGNAIDDVIITDNRFLPVGMAVLDSGRPLHRLLILRNEFGAYRDALYLAHARRITDSVVRWNRFLPGSYIDLAAHQGTIASELGAGLRLDFSSNVVDGVATQALQRPDDAPGFRAAFFWNLAGNNELLLIAGNQIRCPGDKAGDGEAIAFDSTGTELGFAAAPTVVAAGRDWITVNGSLSGSYLGRDFAADYFVGHWLLLAEGPGLGQVRKITSYTEDPAASTVTVHISPAWDVVPSTRSRAIVQRQYWQTYVVGNEIEQGTPPCRKSNLTRPGGGLIGFWAAASDSVIDANHQVDSDGISFAQSYSAHTSSCPSCGSETHSQVALEIRNNRIDGEYDWSSDCSKSGISGGFSASPTSESPPPTVGFGITIDNNEISHADGFRGGAIDFPVIWYLGPKPENWMLVDGVLIQHNSIRDLTGSPPRPNCKYGQRERTGIRVDGKNNVRGIVLYRNTCKSVDRALSVGSNEVVRVCPAGQTPPACECLEQPAGDTP